MDVDGITNGTPASYGRACTNCARAKCRCIYRTENAGCERRCHRLRKECVPSVTVRKRNGRRSHVSRAAQLEEKLEDLVSLLRSQTSAGAAAAEALAGKSVTPTAPAPAETGIGVNTPSPSMHSSHTPSQGGGANSPTPVPCAIFTAAAPGCAASHAERRPAPVARGSLLGITFDPDPPMRIDNSRTGSWPPTPAPVVDPVDPSGIPSHVYQPTPLEAEESLETFRKHMLVFLPFVYLPRNMTAKRLREVNPFLWYNIMTITCKPTDRQLLMSDAIKKFIAQKMVVEHEKSLDLLLGLLSFMGWTHYHRKDKPYLSVMASLIQSLVYDLGLNKAPAEPNGMLPFWKNYEAKKPLAAAIKERTLEERRAVLACFYTTSQAAYTLKKIDPLNWTSHMDECLTVLSAQREWDGDDLLVAQVKIQLIVEQLNRAALQSAQSSQDSGSAGPPAFYLSALQRQLQDIRSRLPHHLQNNAPSSYYLPPQYTPSQPRSHHQQQPFSGLPSCSPDVQLQRYELFESSLRSIKSWFDMFFSIPNYVYVGMTFAYWCHMAHCLMSLYRLMLITTSFPFVNATTTDDGNRDRLAMFRERGIDLFQVMDRLTKGFDEVAQRRRVESGTWGGGGGSTGTTLCGVPREREGTGENRDRDRDDLFDKCVGMMRHMRHHWFAELVGQDASSNTAGGANGNGCGNTTGGGVAGVDGESAHGGAVVGTGGGIGLETAATAAGVFANGYFTDNSNSSMYGGQQPIIDHDSEAWLADLFNWEY
ncbi:hypothetical protein QBC46DRAFT_255934 [Diplogelasinospora grovesii]|uniref:Zn(2)-C6 fungal-type domain-containing protein n=1 Tax=Diplogelasinospora grovesii TaxID=303347 RepID=A0AAN6NBG0_9PEZI|nr:hypothetical protein QBC46DRAFT_255934 [Diplogelasinospora grovesii]